MKFYVYILSSLQNGSFYKGQTSDLQKRINEHNAGKVKSTVRYRPWKIELVIEKESRAEAMLLERKLKNITSKERLVVFIEKYKSENLLT